MAAEFLVIESEMSNMLNGAPFNRERKSPNTWLKTVDIRFESKLGILCSSSINGLWVIMTMTGDVPSTML